jgi:16S rRNA (guanine966-N2)-methyltransferase
VIRIISGTHKGRRIQAPKQLPVRPTTDRAKESLFNILNNRFDWSDISVLDLFSGTGNISYEFSSRGSQNVVAVDAHPACTAFINKTANALELSIQVVKQDVGFYLDRNRQSFDVIFCDPPYDFTSEVLQKLVSQCLTGGHLKPEGILILEHFKQVDLSEMPGFQESRRYGQSVFSFFEIEV